MVLQNFLVGKAPFDDFLLFVVVCDQSNAFLTRQRASNVFVFKHKIPPVIRECVR
jgi:hypothetical protein